MIGRKDWELQQAILKHNCCDGEASSSGGGTGEIDYEAVYQFQIKKLKDDVPPEVLSEAIIPEHYSDVTYCVGTKHPTGTLGIFKTSDEYYGSVDLATLTNLVNGILFMDWTNGDIIFFGEYSYNDGQGPFI